MIKFGTDGWRAIIDEDFTLENVAKIVQAFADIYPDLRNIGRPVVIGYDRRRLSRESAETAAQTLVANGIRTVLSDCFSPTPCVSWMVKDLKAHAGIMITASHNPPKWNGVKFKEGYGGSASQAYTDPIEEKIKENEGKIPKTASLPHQLCKAFSPHDKYVDNLRTWVDLKLIRDSRFKILAEPMYGCGAGFFPEFVDDVTEIHANDDPDFGGLQPEPIIPHVNEAIEVMKRGGFDICLITDGDADRIGAIDENGRYVTSHEIFSLVLKHLVEVRKWRGNVVKSITTTQMIDRLCERSGLALEVTPVGFKHISPALNKSNMLIGGEESGGIGIPRHVCERDGILCGLLLLEIMAVNEKRLGELVTRLQSDVGPVYYKRIDLHLDKTTIAKAREALESRARDIHELAGKRVKRLNLLDGYHFLMEDDSWLLARPSGTEPLLRTYAEARTPEDVEKLLEEAKRLIGL